MGDAIGRILTGWAGDDSIVGEDLEKFVRFSRLLARLSPDFVQKDFDV